MTREDFLQIILDWAATNSGLDRSKWLFKDQRGTPPDMPYGTIKILSGPKVLGLDELRDQSNGGTPPPAPAVYAPFTASGQRRYLVEIEIYSSLDNQNQEIDPNNGALELMKNLRNSLELPEVTDSLFAQGISVNEKQDTQNLSQALEDVFQERAVLNLVFGYGENVPSKVGIIEKVGIGGTVDGNVNPTPIAVPQKYYP